MGEVPTPPETAAPAGTTTYGGVWKRLGARIIDGIIVGIPVYVVFLVVPGLRPLGLVYGLVAAAASLGYFVFLESSRGATFGKEVLGMKVVDGSGTSPIGVDASLRRNWWLALNALNGVPIIGLLLSLVALGVVIAIAVTISSDARNQGLHDKMASTFVLDR